MAESTIRPKARQAAAESSSRRPRWLPPIADPRAEAILVAAFQVFVEHGFERGGITVSAALASEVDEEAPLAAHRSPPCRLATRPCPFAAIASAAPVALPISGLPGRSR